MAQIGTIDVKLASKTIRDSINKLNNMKKLPKYFVIKRDGNIPLWEKYVNWLNETYCVPVGESRWGGSLVGFYGYDGNSKHESGTNYYSSIDDFDNNPELITLEYWKECVNGVKPTEIEIDDTIKSVMVDFENNKVITTYYDEKQKHNFYDELFYLMIQNGDIVKIKDDSEDIVYARIRKYKDGIFYCHSLIMNSSSFLLNTKKSAFNSIKYATPKQQSKLIKKELKFGYIWDNHKQKLVNFD